MAEYVLGTDKEELDRLNLQHELWKLEALRLWDRAGFKQGQKILDLGCGPGFTSMELARRLGPTGQVTAVDVSERFLSHLNSLSKDPHQAKITTAKTFIEEMNLEKKDYDGAYCRWLMIFVKDPLAALKSVHHHLKSGAVFCLQEYVAYDSMALAPDEPIMKNVVNAIFKSWRDQGGDPNRGRDLPQLLHQAGFEEIEMKPLIRFARPQDPLWSWPDSFYRNFIPKLVQGGYLSQQEAKFFFEI